MIDLDAGNRVEPPKSSVDADIVMQELPPASVLASAQGTSSGAKAALGIEIVSLSPIPPATNIFALNHVLEDQVRATKEALIQLGVMSERLKRAYDASVALQKNVQVSTLVSTLFNREF